MKNVKDYVTEADYEEIHRLVMSLSDLCDKRIPRLIKKLQLKSLKKFNITVEGVSLTFSCDDDVFDEMSARARGKDEKKLDYYG